MPILLSESDVRAVLPMDALIETMRGALAQFSARQVTQPLRTVIQAGADPSFFAVMPAAMPEPATLGAKLVTVVSRNAAAGLPTHLATIVLLDPETGALLAILDGRYITEARTAAVSAVATDLLARQEAETLAVIGTGVQARSHLEAIACVRRLREVRAWSRDPDRREAFVRDARSRTVAPVHACQSAREAVTGAAIVVLVTSAAEPVVLDDWIEPGTHLCAVGACRPDQREMDGRLVARARLFVDSREAALVEAGDVILAMKEGLFGADHIAAEIGEVAAGRAAGRQAAGEVTVFKSLGLAVEDIAAARLAYERAIERGLGRGFLL